MVMATIVLVEARAQHRDRQDGEHQVGHRHDEVHHPRDHDVDERAVEGGGQPQHDADHEGHAHHRRGR